MPGCILQAILVQKWAPVGGMNPVFKNTQAHAQKPVSAEWLSPGGLLCESRLVEGG